MKLAITSDFHVGYNEDALPQAQIILSKAAQLADAVIIAGDLFDVRVPKQEVVNDGVKLFKTYIENTKSEVKIKKGERTYERPVVIAIAGTHERRTKGLVNVIELLDSAGVLINCHNKHVTIEKSGEKIVVLGMAGVPEEYAVDVIKAGQFKPLPQCFNIFMFHQNLKEVIPMAPGPSMEDLPPGFDLYINGHIHWKREIKTSDKTLLIPGSGVITQMRKNETEKKGFWLYDTLTKTYEFIHIDSRPFFYTELNLENTTVEKINDAIKTYVDALPLNGKPLVKIKLRGSLAKGLNASAIDVSTITTSYEKVEMYIDKEFETAETLKEKIELIRKLKTEEKTVAEIGIALLKEKLKHNNYSLAKEEELFSLLSEGEVEKAVELVKSVKPSS